MVSIEGLNTDKNSENDKVRGAGIQKNKGNHLDIPAKHQQGLAGEKRLRLPPGTRRTMLPPPAVILGTPSRPRRRRDDWGVGNPEEQRQPP